MAPILGVAAFVLWLYGLTARPGDARIHLLLLSAGVALAIHFVQGRRARRRSL